MGRRVIQKVIAGGSTAKRKYKGIGTLKNRFKCAFS